MNFNITRRIDCSTRGYNLLSPRYEPNPCYDIETIQLLRLHFFIRWIFDVWFVSFFLCMPSRKNKKNKINQIRLRNFKFIITHL